MCPGSWESEQRALVGKQVGGAGHSSLSVLEGRDPSEQRRLWLRRGASGRAGDGGRHVGRSLCLRPCPLSGLGLLQPLGGILGFAQAERL